MSDVNAELFYFMMHNETGLYTKNFAKDKTVHAFVRVHFHQLDEFARIFGPGQFDEGGLEVTMFEDHIVILLDDYLEGMGHKLSDYYRCFDKHVWDEYHDCVFEMEGEYD